MKKLHSSRWCPTLRQRPWQLLKLAEKEWKQKKKAQQRMISECGRSATYEMRRKLDLQFPSECCCSRIGAVGLINDLGVNASVTLFHSLTSSENWLFSSLCLFEFLIILIFSERFVLAYWNPLLLWLVESCSAWRRILCGEKKMVSDALGPQQLWQWIIVFSLKKLCL